MRKQCSIPEAVYWYNITPKDEASSSTAPANEIHKYEVQLKGIDIGSEVIHNLCDTVGDTVCVKMPQSMNKRGGSVGSSAHNSSGLMVSHAMSSIFDPC